VIGVVVVAGAAVEIVDTGDAVVVDVAVDAIAIPEPLSTAAVLNEVADGDCLITCLIIEVGIESLAPTEDANDGYDAVLAGNLLDNGDGIQS
jgi:hypothetical protein